MSVFFTWAALITAVIFVSTTRFDVLKVVGKDLWRLSYVILKFLVGYGFGVFIFNILLMDRSFTAYFTYLAIPISILMLWESTWRMKKEKSDRGIYLSIGLLLLVAFSFVKLIYPMTLAEEKLDASQGVLSKEKTLEATDEKHLPVVGDEYALYVAKRELSTWKKNISYFELGNGIKQSINGTLYYVFPIEYRGFSKWMKGQPVPGFIEVNAENPNVEPKFIQSEMSYIPSAYFNDNVRRLVRLKNPGFLLMDTSFEVDDQNHPFYVIPYGHFDSFRNIRQVDGAILVDPKTGEQTKYSTNDVPAFVDQIIPTDVAFERMDWFGSYREGGWFNAHGILGAEYLSLSIRSRHTYRMG